MTKCRTIAGVLRLSTKYDVPDLRRRALNHLASVFPTTLAAWDNRSSTRTFPEIDGESKDHLLLLELITEVNALWLLPAALYDCGYPSSDITASRNITADVSYRLTHAYPRIVNAGTRLILNVFTKSEPFCESVAECGQTRLGHLSYNLIAPAHMPELCLSTWEELDYSDLPMNVLCLTCLASCKATLDAERKKVWEKLPRMYDLPLWAELENLKAEAFREE